METKRHTGLSKLIPLEMGMFIAEGEGSSGLCHPLPISRVQQHQRLSEHRVSYTFHLYPQGENCPMSTKVFGGWSGTHTPQVYLISPKVPSGPSGNDSRSSPNHPSLEISPKWRPLSQGHVGIEE